MNRLEIIGLITAFCTLFSGLVVWAAERFFVVKRADFTKVDKAILVLVQGKWKGIYRQLLKGEHITVLLTLTINVSKRGKVVGEIYFESNNQRYFIEVWGGFYMYNFIKLEYRNANRGINQFGSFVLKLNANGDNLTGCFVGHGNIAERVISGDVNLNKE